MRSAPRTTIPLLIVVCLAVTGCQKAYRAETILHADGRVERSIYQPANDTPAIVKLDPGWKQTTFAPNPDGLEHQGWIAAKWGVSDQKRRAKFYALTRAGRRQLEKEAAAWERLAAAITLVVRTA